MDCGLAYLLVRRNHQKAGNAHSKEKFSSHRKFCSRDYQRSDLLTNSMSLKVQFQQAEDHKLVMNGIYKLARHPSYLGWFYWSLGTQVILANPLCLIFYIVASWLFFRERIYMEEIALLNFFGDEYLRYQQSTSTGLPFIHGYSIS